MSTTLATILSTLESDFDDTPTSGTVDSGSTTTIVDAARTEDNDRWSGKWAYIDTDAGGAHAAPEGQERRISDFTASNDTITVDTAFTAETAIGDTYSIREKFSRAAYIVGINHGIREGARAFGTVTVDETIVICSDKMNYTLPGTPTFVYQVWIEEPDSEDSGTAESGAATTLTDSDKSWTVNGWANYEVRIYDGTGAGQSRTISSNTATVLTVSAAWTTNPSSDSKYKIVDVVNETQQWEQLTDCNPDTESLKLRFPVQHTEGAKVRVIYESEPSTLSATTDTTEIPVEFILDIAKSHLWATKVGSDPSADFFSQWFWGLAEGFKKGQPYRRPSATFWTWVADRTYFENPLWSER